MSNLQRDEAIRELVPHLKECLVMGSPPQRPGKGASFYTRRASGVSFSTVENQASGLMTVLVQVEESALSSARSVFLGLAPEDRSGRSSALNTLVASTGDDVRR